MGRWLDRLAELEPPEAPCRPVAPSSAGSAGTPPDLAAAILADLADNARRTARQLADRLGVERDALYPALGELLDAGRIATDPRTCTFNLRWGLQ